MWRENNKKYSLQLHFFLVRFYVFVELSDVLASINIIGSLDNLNDFLNQTHFNRLLIFDELMFLVDNSKFENSVARPLTVTAVIFRCFSSDS